MLEHFRYENPETSTGRFARLFGYPQATPDTTGVGSAYNQWSWLVTDTGDDGWETAAIADMGMHILHAEDEAACWVEIAGTRIDAHPGDSLLAYTDDVVRFASGLIVVVFGGDWQSRRRRRRATHGEESFVGHNRRTTYDETRHMAFDRWKLTQPVRFATDSEIVVLCIFGAVSTNVGGSILNLHPGQAVALVGGVDIVPDGLAYVMTIWDPEYSRGASASSLG